MMQDIHFSDEELVAYLDGESEFAPVDEIALALKTDIALAKRLECLRVDTHAVRAGFDGLLDADKKPPVLRAQAPRTRTFMPVAAAAALAMVIGFSLGFLATGKTEGDWEDYVAAYQALYTTSTLNHVQVSADLQQQELDRVSSAIGKTIKVASLSGFPEVEYKRAQVLGFRGKALVQLAFLDSMGEPLALCIIRADENDTDAVRLRTLEGLSAASWRKDGYAYLLIGGQDESLVSRMASTFVQRRV